ncbi:MAG TPA: shikimate kinase [Flavobacteriaceae bacterium]|nr:shikimate kinase [Flavobacteriaceae bacterium]HAT65521.1 shikimate kinase [Flavobacteriaceae bacterium]|tara:strand:- start:412 stop:933 length:522 start_codon:yes stop_codon:yes gene_type:complete
MKLVLIGYMGSGKSLLGKHLSKVMNIPFQDLDAYIETSENASISQLFETKGEIYFRKKEALLLQKILSENFKLILATGGGTPCYGAVMEDLLRSNNVLTVYLKCSVDTLVERLWKEKESRPLISHINSKEVLNDFIRKHLFERNYYYNQANIIVGCDGLSEKEIVEKILFKLF